MYTTKNYRTDGGDKWVVDGVNLNSIVKAVAGNMIIEVTPSTIGSSAADILAAIVGENLKYTRDIKLKLIAIDGSTHDWYNGAMNIAVTETTAGDGTSTIADNQTTVTFINGEATVTVEYIGTWAEADTQTLTITGGNILGYAITNKTSIDTLIA